MNDDWDQYFMGLAYYVATKSKDRSTTVGSVIVGPDNEIRTTGYNSFVRGFDEEPKHHERPLKYEVTEHAERNAIYNAARVGTPLNRCRIYLPWLPCTDGARAIIQSGIIEVITPKENPGSGNWMEKSEIIVDMFHKCGVKLREWSGEIEEIRGRINGKEFVPSDIKI